MRLYSAILTMLLSGLLLAAPAVAWVEEKDIRPAVMTFDDANSGQPDGMVLLARGGHRGNGHDRFFHGGHRGHGHDRFFHGGHRHPHHFRSHVHRHHFRHFDGHVGHSGHFRSHRNFHPGFGVSFCIRDAGVLVCFNDRAFGHRYYRW